MKGSYTMDEQPIYYQRLMKMLIISRLQHNPHLLAIPPLRVAPQEQEKAHSHRCLYGPLQYLRGGSTASNGDEARVILPPHPIRPDRPGDLVAAVLQDRSV